MENLDAVNTAHILEMYVALLGIILFTPIFLPEQNKDLMDLIRSKYTSLTLIILIRICESAISMIVLIGIFIINLKNNNCYFPEIKFYLGTLSEATFLGGMGLCALRIFDQIAIAYMLPMFYYMIAFYMGKRLLKDFYLFSMAYGGYHEKVILMLVGLAFIATGICYPLVTEKVITKLIS